MSTDEWLPAAQAAAYLGRTDRQLRRYKEAGRVRSRVRNGRIEYQRADIEALKADLAEDTRPRAPNQEIVPAGELLTLIREQQAELQQAAAQIGYFRAQLESRPALEDTQRLQSDLDAAHRQNAEQQRRIAELEEQLAKRRRGIRWPWQKDDDRTTGQ